MGEKEGYHAIREGLGVSIMAQIKLSLVMPVSYLTTDSSPKQSKINLLPKEGMLCNMRLVEEGSRS